MSKYLIAFLFTFILINNIFADSSNDTIEVMTYYRIASFIIPIVCALTIFEQIDTKKISVLVFMSLTFHFLWIIATAIIINGNVNIPNITIAVKLIYLA